MARSDVKAFNHDQGDDAAVVGPARSRLRQLIVFANSAGAVTIKDGSGGSDILVQSFPTGLHHLNIPADGILAENGVFVHAFTGSGNKLTLMLA
jgi:hypothetical protein|tara:strand:- start:246 stop:527 length:282 start_codon:yes stop_codon:yes gene_type:complete